MSILQRLEGVKLIFSVVFQPIDDTTAIKAAELRGRYNLGLADAFQIAIAVQAGCKAFLTNDLDLRRVKDISIIVVGEE